MARWNYGNIYDNVNTPHRDDSKEVVREERLTKYTQYESLYLP